MTGEVLLALCLRADLDVTPADETESGVRARHDRWPERTVRVVADDDALAAALDAASGEVEELWPGRDRDDGALALLATSLRAALDARQVAPTTAAFSFSGKWVLTPPDDSPQSVVDADEGRWSAPDRGGAPG